MLPPESQSLENQEQCSNQSVEPLRVTATQDLPNQNCCAYVSLPIATFDAILTLVRSIRPDLLAEGLTSLQLNRETS
jgi:hypothetical protein